ncbi:N-6 DNA methylase [uncultured Mucilaginibacter sp.]|uniref:Eco57I restriction-modification methylase domain-containing protein n=1 Tax=uncultured Mucilaginibacter sp. TaxID=797541 RepID=UPI002610A5BF|nr:N-6 DNA methylase [uncultured Mucilaginibacter sp.]
MGKIKTHQKLPTKWSEREILRDKGQFWTPNWVAEAMIAYITEDTDLVFDPATGRGAFYEALTILNKPLVSFYGTDIDEEVLADEIYNGTNCIVEKRDFIKNPPKRKFRSIVANPPYIRHHRIDEETKAVLKKLSINITGEKIDGRAGYHIYFLIQALNLLEQDGKLAFIMPADTCEGKFAKNLWKWISENFCIDCVITFDEKATPFPNVDTNAIVFLIKNSIPTTSLYWVKANEAYSTDLFDFVSLKFKKQKFATLDVFNRQLKEGIATGFSRPEQNHNGFKFHLNDFANVMRGIATGSNEFFFLTATQVKEINIPEEFLKRAIGRTKDATESILTLDDVHQLENENRPTYLLSIKGTDNVPLSVSNYLEIGEKMGLPNRALIQQRKPWYKMEKREVPPLLFAYLGRRNTRFIKNEAAVLPLTGFLCVYPLYNDKDFVDKLWQALNHPDTLENLKLVGKSYGSGAIKVEPNNLSKLPIPEHIVKEFDLERQYKTASGQLRIFREQEN